MNHIKKNEPQKNLAGMFQTLLPVGYAKPAQARSGRAP